MVKQAEPDAVDVEVWLNWGVPEKSEIERADSLKAAEFELIRLKEFKNTVKFGLELWEKNRDEKGRTKLRYSSCLWILFWCSLHFRLYYFYSCFENSCRGNSDLFSILLFRSGMLKFREGKSSVGIPNLKI